MKEMIKKWFRPKPPERDGEWLKIHIKDVCIGDTIKGCGVVIAKYKCLGDYYVWCLYSEFIIGTGEYVWVKR